jgi:hypothetical protein
MMNEYMYYKNVIFDWGILEPDLGYQYVLSVFACAILCLQKKCSTFNVVSDIRLPVCQMASKKGTCMEKEDAFRQPGSRMYQKRVDNRSYKAARFS